MSKLEELIQELCPNGIQYHLIGDICDVLTGGEAPPESIKEKEPQGEYIYPIYSNGLGDNALWGYSKTFRIDKPAVTFSSIGTIGFPTLREAKFTPIIRLKVIYPKDANKLNICFLKYALEIVQFEKQKSSVANVNASMIKNIKIPVPPLEVQQEIVRLLDEFTAKTAELQAELNKEYEARKKQYEYYRDSILTFNQEIPIYKLGDIATILRGASPRPIKNYLTDNDGVNWIKIGDADPESKYITSCKEKITQKGAAKSRKVYVGDFLLSNSMSFGRPYILKIDGCIHDGWLSITNFNKLLTRDYLYHILMSSKIQLEMKKKASFGGAVQNLNADIVRQIEIPVPNISIQNKISNTLDNFDSICSDLNIGLPAEIEARQKQYEFYRDQLLTFAENGNTILTNNEQRTTKESD